jgi:glutaredoxin
MRQLAICILLLASATIHADTLYKSVDSKGTITYSDNPPQAGKIVETFNYTYMPASRLPDSVIREQAAMQKNMKARLSATASSNDMRQTTLFSAQWCGYCRKAKAYLAEKNVSYKEYDIDTADGKQAFAALGRRGGIPVLVLNGKTVQGFSRNGYDAAFGLTQ